MTVAHNALVHRVFTASVLMAAVLVADPSGSHLDSLVGSENRDLTPGTPSLPWLRERIWFAPGPGTPDMLRLFEALDEWPEARKTIDVFKFYHGHTTKNPPSNTGPNRYEAFVRVDAFRKLMRWGKVIAIEAGAVKEGTCTPDESGMRKAVDDTVEAIGNVRAAGGRVKYIAMDEPFTSGQLPRCGGPALEPTVDRLVTYFTGIQRVFPDVQIGLIEAYPFLPVDTFVKSLRLMRERNILPVFLHVDIDLGALPPGRQAFGRDILHLADLARAHDIPFGLIIWGGNGDADALYAADALELADVVHHTFRTWSVMPDHLIFQSWAVSSTGLLITPTNLPETRPYTLTALVNDIYRTFRTTVIPRR